MPESNSKNAIISCLWRPSWILGDILKNIIINFIHFIISLMSSKKIYTYLIILKKVVRPIDPLNVIFSLKIVKIFFDIYLLLNEIGLVHFFFTSTNKTFIYFICIMIIPMVTNQNRLSPYLGFLSYFHNSHSYTLCNCT